MRIGAVALSLASFVRCNLVADVDGYHVAESTAGGNASGGATTTSGGAGGVGGAGGSGGGDGGGETLSCGDAECTGQHRWTVTFSGMGDEWVTALAVEPSSDAVYFGGEFLSEIVLGTTTFTTVDNERDIYFGKLSATGELLWALSSSTTYADYLGGLTVDNAGNLVGVGYFAGPLSLGGTNLDAGFSFDMLLFQVDAGGGVAWAKNLGGAGDVRGRAVAPHPDGGVVVVGEFNNVLDLGGGPLSNIGGTDGFMAHFDATGAHLWSQSVGGPGNDVVLAVAATPDGGFVVLGRSDGVVDLGGGSLAHAGDIDLFVGKYDGFAVHQWSQNFGGSARDEGLDLTVDGEGRVFVVGEFRDTISFGDISLTSAGDADAFVLVLDPQGVPLLGDGFGDAAYQSARAVTHDTFANLLLGGVFRGTIDLGGDPLVGSSGDDDIFLAKLAMDGAHRYSRQFGDPGPENQRIDRVAHDSQGAGILAGTFAGSVNFGGGPVSAQSGSDIFIVKLEK